MDNLLIVLIMVAAATTTMSILSIIFLYRNNTNLNFLRFFSSSATSSLIRSKHNRIQLPFGTLGLPFLGETIEFVTCAYSDSPENFMDKRRHAKKKMVKLVQKIIQARKKKSDIIFNKVPKDVVDVLLSDTSEQLTDNLIENTKLKTQKDELGEPLCWSDYLSLPFTQNVITETLRMGNIITGVMRKAMKDVEIKGYLIPKGWCVFTYFRSVHLDQNNYDWPYHFNPWRWQDKDMSSCNFTSFGGGQRLCPGLDLARLEASIFLHYFVTQFSCLLKVVLHFPSSFMHPPRRPASLERKGELCVLSNFLKETLIEF
ncbi:unnamed protein product [Malus baccata var. baccata]